MFDVKKLLTTSLACLMLLTACSTTKPTISDEQAQKTKTAKINAQLGIAYLESNNIHRAKKKLLIALEQDPNIPEPWYSMAYYMEATGSIDQAKKYYLKAVELAPERGDTQNNYGTFLCRNGFYKESIERFMQAVKDPDYIDTADAYENAGLCALKIPNKRLAVRYFNMALKQNPARPTSVIKLAQLYYDIGNYSSAKAKIDQYLTLAPSNPQITSLLANIKNKTLRNNNDSELFENNSKMVEKSVKVTYRKFLKEGQPKNKVVIKPSAAKTSIVHPIKKAKIEPKPLKKHALAAKKIRTAFNRKHLGVVAKNLTAIRHHAKAKLRHDAHVYSWRV